MSVTFPPATIVSRFNTDPEFRIHARFWTGQLQFGVGEALYRISLEDGEVTAAELDHLEPLGDPQRALGSSLVRITGPSEGWERLIREPAPPFYLDYQSAAAHHGFTLEGDPDTLWAYYPAIRRTAELLRDIAHREDD